MQRRSRKRYKDGCPIVDLHCQVNACEKVLRRFQIGDDRFLERLLRELKRWCTNLKQKAMVPLDLMSMIFVAVGLVRSNIGV